VVFAGSTHPAASWLDRLADGGRLMMPLTSENRIETQISDILGQSMNARAIGSPQYR